MIKTKAERRETITVEHRGDRGLAARADWTLAGAVSITAIIVVSSFVLSFATLRDLAVMAGIANELSWLWPVVVDGTILQATISVIALTRTNYHSGARLLLVRLVRLSRWSVCPPTRRTQLKSAAGESIRH